MFRVIAKENGLQVQAVEYEDLQYGLEQMAILYPQAEISSVDMEAEAQAKEAADAAALADQQE